MTQFGLAIRNFVGPGEVPDVHTLYAYAQRAEELGYESLWAWDHILLGVEPSFPILDSITTLGAIAARTTRIKLGAGVLVLPLRNPVVAAKALGSLDVISGGRLILGVAAGWYRYGIRMRRSTPVDTWARSCSTQSVGLPWTACWMVDSLQAAVSHSVVSQRRMAAEVSARLLPT